MSKPDAFNSGNLGGGSGGGGNGGGSGSGGSGGGLNGAVAGDPAPAGPRLAAPDAAALDALTEANWEVHAVAPEHRERAARIAGLLAVLDTPPASRFDDDALEDVVLLRVARVRAASPANPASGPRTLELSADDARALDVLVDASMDPAALELRDAQRARRHIGLLSLLDIDPGTAEERERRIQSTLRAIQGAIDEQDGRMELETVSRRRRIQFADLVSVAALLLIASAVMWPIMEELRSRGQRAACQTGLQTAGIGFGQYASGNRDHFPMASASRAGTPWWDVGGDPGRSNSANLFTLSRTGYTTVGDLACIGNPSAARTDADTGEQDWRRFGDISYSYRMMFGRPASTMTESPDGVVLADRSPMVLVRPGVLRIQVFQNSPNHGGKGQSVLLGDGSVRWITSPLFKDGDNLWLPRSVEQALNRLNGPVDPKVMRGIETPGGTEDDFVAP